MAKPKTKIINSTNYSCLIKGGSFGVYRKLTELPPGSSYIVTVDTNATYRDDYVHIEVGGKTVGPISSDDFAEGREITIYETVEETLNWRISKPRYNSDQDPTKNIPPQIPIERISTPPFSVENAVAFAALRDDASSKIDAIKGSLARLVELSNQVMICSGQCKYLVQACSNGISGMRTIYSALSENEMYELYRSRKLPLLKSSLDRLLLTLASAKDLLLACGRGCRLMGLVVTIPLPDPEKKASSNFDLVVKELSWNLDMIRFTLELRKNIGFHWDESSCRSALVLPENATGAVVAVAIRPDLVESESLASKDRMDFLPKLKDGSILTSEKSFATVLKKRLEISVLPNEVPDGPTMSRRQRCLNPGPGSRVPAAETDHLDLAFKALEPFQIPHLDPIIQKNSRPLGAGSSKSTFKGKWCGLVVAIGVTKTTRIVDLKMEALLMLRLQHPNVVGFFGWGFYVPPIPAATLRTQAATLREETVATSLTQAATLCEENTGFIVMELMERDLGSEIQRLNLIKSSYGGPFSLPVAVDILQQIVEAMVHMHNLDHAHRDLKAENCLVKRRSLLESNTQDLSGGWPGRGLYSSVVSCFARLPLSVTQKKDSQALANSLQHGPDSYIVKLIDFGTAKRIDPDLQSHTANRGTKKWMAPEVWAEPGIKLTHYDPKPADVFSFGMVCYEVITGKIPFDTLLPSAQKKKLNDEEYKRGGRLLSIPDTASCPEVLQELISKCWAYKPSDRPDFKSIQKDLWRIKTDLEIKDIK